MPVLELVKWRDAYNDGESWKDEKDIDDQHYLVTSVGFVVKETENNLTLAMDIGEDGMTNTRGRIPKGMIVSRTVIVL